MGTGSFCHKKLKTKNLDFGVLTYLYETFNGPNILFSLDKQGYVESN